MNISLKFRERMTSVGLWLEEEFDNIIARIKGGWEIEHKENGTHAGIHGDSIDVTGAVSAGGTGTFGGTVKANTEDAPITLGEVGGANIAAGPGIEIDGTRGNVAGLVGRWVFSVYPGPLGGGFNNRALALSDITSGTFGQTPFIFWFDGSDYYLSPDDVTQSSIGVNLGDLQQSAGQGRFTRVYARGLDVGLFSTDNSADGVISALNGFRERGRTTAMGIWQSYTTTLTNLSIGNGSVSASFTYIAGKTVAYRILIVLGSTSSVTGHVAFTTPTAHLANGISQSIGDVTVFDSDAGNLFAGKTQIIASPGAQLYTGTSPMAAVTATSPIVFAVNDQIHIFGVYQEP